MVKHDKEKLNHIDEISNRLDAIIRLQIAQLNSKENYGMDKILMILDETKLSTSDIAKIFGKPSSNISSMINMAKKRAKNRSKNFKK